MDQLSCEKCDFLRSIVDALSVSKLLVLLSVSCRAHLCNRTSQQKHLRQTTAQRCEMSISLCEHRIPLLLEAHQLRFANQIERVAKALGASDLDSAVSICRQMPRKNIADFWQSMDWMEEHPVPFESKETLPAHCSQTLKAFEIAILAKPSKINTREYSARHHSMPFHRGGVGCRGRRRRRLRHQPIRECSLRR